MKSKRHARHALMLMLLVVGGCLSGRGHAAEQVVGNSHSRHVILMAQLTVKPGREQAFIKLLAQMKQRVKKEDHGNIRYELYSVTPIGRQHEGAASRFLFVEEWQNQAAFTAHGKWAGAIVRDTWPMLTDSMQVMLLNEMSLR